MSEKPLTSDQFVVLIARHERRIRSFIVSLAASSVDAVLMLKTYHEIAEPIRLLANLRAAMKPGALLGIIDRDGDGGDHGIDSSMVIEEAARAGFEKVEQYDFVKPDGMDYFLILRPRPATRD